MERKKTNIEGGYLEREEDEDKARNVNGREKKRNVSTLVYLEATSDRRRLRATHGETGRCHFCTVQYKTPNRKVRPKISRRVQRHLRLRPPQRDQVGYWLLLVTGGCLIVRDQRKKRRKEEEEERGRAARVISAGGRWRNWRWKRKKRRRRRKEEEAGAEVEKKERTRKDGE
ncbi:hypothetical protein G5I_14599 [Acromyrmex echinatior]|uniref:Uncharacterized protein n=1 Tax=Acromyrmex echinatior TaxID=103372 RepID=F4X860_ACREC|nr:hypothetical protein G5I_14599 [Acromyrmex echinatior]